MRQFLFLLILLPAFVSTPAFARAVTYDIGPYAAGGFAASFLHSADGCRGRGNMDINRNGRPDTLYMCGEEQTPVGGTLTGQWDGERLTRITGNIAGHRVLRGSLGGDFENARSRPRWTLTLARLGTFIFESLPINRINERELTLWGQNMAAYKCRSDRCRDRRGRGLDLYGQARESLPEPGTLSILLGGLLGAGVALRRRRRTASG